MRENGWWKDNRKKAGLIASLSSLALLAVGAWAGTIKEADYPNQYEVIDTSATNKLAIEKYCSMTLREKAKPDIAINVAKKGYGSCHLPQSGKVYRGRENDKKDKIEIVIPVGADKARVEDWQIVGTSDLHPQ